MYVDEIDDNTKQFASVLNELPMTSEGNQEQQNNRTRTSVL